ncbi:MAG: glyoxalase superfamily protein [Paracoccaceae bacterium]
MEYITQAKPMAKALRKALLAQDIPVSHSQSLELVARQFGCKNWNTLSAKITAQRNDMLKQPNNWFITRNTNLRFYRFGLDPSMKNMPMLESKPDAKNLLLGGFASYMQSIGAKGFSGQRVRVKADIKTQNAHLATIWMRADDADKTVLAFDNMMHAGGTLSGTHDWTSRNIVLDIPPNAATLHYGFLLKHTGRMWARDFRLETVDQSVAMTVQTQDIMKTG